MHGLILLPNVVHGEINAVIVIPLNDGRDNEVMVANGTAIDPGKDRNLGNELKREMKLIILNL